MTISSWYSQAHKVAGPCNIQLSGGEQKFALSHTTAVRGVHFQPVSYFGRYPAGFEGLPHITLPEVMRALEEQTEGLVRTSDLRPPGCEHALCSFHGSFIRMPDGSLKPIAGSAGTSCCSDSPQRGVTRTVSLVSKQWAAPRNNWCPPPAPGGANDLAGGNPVDTELMDLDTFLEQTLSNSFTISCMAFQDSGNLDLERLRQCCISIVAPDGRLVPFCAYNLTDPTGRKLYRDRGEASCDR